MKITTLALSLLALTFGALQAAETEKPNIILILSDDQGFPDYGFMGHPAIQTPASRQDGRRQPALHPRLRHAGLLALACLPADRKTSASERHHRQRPCRENQRPLGALAKQLLGNAPLLPQAVTDAGYLTFQTGKLWNVTYKEVGFTDGMTDTAGRHGDAGLTIGRNGMKPIFDFIEKAPSRQKALLHLARAVPAASAAQSSAGNLRPLQGQGPDSGGREILCHGRLVRPDLRRTRRLSNQEQALPTTPSSSTWPTTAGTPNTRTRGTARNSRPTNSESARPSSCAGRERSPRSAMRKPSPRSSTSCRPS